MKRTFKPDFSDVVAAFLKTANFKEANIYYAQNQQAVDEAVKERIEERTMASVLGEFRRSGCKHFPASLAQKITQSIIESERMPVAATLVAMPASYQQSRIYRD